MMWGAESSFFDPAKGTDPVYFQHLMWLLGHPEFYLIIGQFLLAIIGAFLIARQFARAHRWSLFAASIAATAGLAVWHVVAFQCGQTSYMKGAYPDFWVRLPFYISRGVAFCVLLSPFIIYRRAIKRNTIGALFLVAVVAFLIAGLVELYLLSAAATNSVLHHTYLILASMRVLLHWAALSVVFILTYFLFRRVLGVDYNRWLGGIHWFFWVLGSSLFFYPQHLIGQAGMPRRYPDYSEAVDQISRWTQIGAVMLGVSLMLFLLVIAEGLFRRNRNGGRPDRAYTADNSA